MDKKEELAQCYASSVEHWEKTLPLGNERILIIPDGGLDSEIVVLNDITMWSARVTQDIVVQSNGSGQEREVSFEVKGTNQQTIIIQIKQQD